MAPKEPSASGIYVSPGFRERLLLELFSRSGEADSPVARLPQRELGVLEFVTLLAVSTQKDFSR
jgi:hypothetical protein